MPLIASGVKSHSVTSPRIKPAPGLLTRGGTPTALVDLVLAAVPSPNTRRSYARAIEDLYAYAAGRPITLVLLLEWRTAMAGTLSTSTVNTRIAAVRTLVRGAQRSGAIDVQEAWELLSVEGLPQRGVRLGRWLTAAQTRRLLSVPNRKDLRGLRNYCIVAVLIGCMIRVSELAGLELETIQERDGRWVLADLMGKGGRVRTVPIPAWVKQALDAWLKAAKITDGKVIRQLTLAPEGLSTEGVRDIVQKMSKKIGVDKLGPHDLRRTGARLCRQENGDLEQIQMVLGHASLITTQRYLGTVQDLRNAVNDRQGL
jgi:integrase